MQGFWILDWAWGMGHHRMGHGALHSFPGGAWERHFGALHSFPGGAWERHFGGSDLKRFVVGL